MDITIDANGQKFTLARPRSESRASRARCVPDRILGLFDTPAGNVTVASGFAVGTADLVIDVTGWWRYGTFSFSIITRYEILRGLKAKNAIVQLRAFDRLCAGSQIVPLTDGAVVKASEIYAELRRRGEYPARKDLPPFRRARRRGSRGGIY